VNQGEKKRRKPAENMLSSRACRRDALPEDPETLKAMLIAERVRSERLVQIIKELQRHRFGRRAETLQEDQLLLALEDLEQGEARNDRRC
jgi:transposase